MLNHCRRPRLPLLGAAVSVCCLVAGCGTRIPSNPSTYAVRGKVTLAGQHLKAGYIRFDPVSPGKGTSADGPIKPDGTFEVRAFVGQPGTTPGEYKVSLASVPRGQEGEVVAQPLPIPTKYLRPDTTDIVKTVIAGDNAFDVELAAK